MGKEHGYTESDNSLDCPYCDFKYDEPFRIVGDEETDVKCDGCGKTFIAELTIWGVTYTGWKKELGETAPQVGAKDD